MRVLIVLGPPRVETLSDKGALPWPRSATTRPTSAFLPAN